ncbi:MAG: c-type cytochrome, partial [Pseudomonadota bacterium]
MHKPASYFRHHLVCAVSLLVFLSPMPSAEERDGETIYVQFCAACHDVGTAQAPLLSDDAYWAELLKQAGSTSALANTVVEGKGAMPRMGGCGDCNQDEIRLAVEYMMPGGHSSAAITRQHIEDVIGTIELPAGFSISLYAKGVTGARQLALGDDGVVYVGSRGQGNVYALVPNADNSAAAVHVLL